MNRYPLWKYIIIAVALVVGLLYTLPNFFGEVPAVQISSGKSTARSVTFDIGNGVGVEMTIGNLVSSGRGVTVSGVRLFP